MLEHIRQHDANQARFGLRSWMGAWKHGDRWMNREDRATNYSYTKMIGQKIAQSGVMRMRPIIPLAVAQVVFDAVENEANRLELLRSLLGGDIAAALQRDNKRFDETYWEAVPWAREVWYLLSPLRLLHSTHVPREEKNREAGCIAFAEAPPKLTADRFTVMKAGRYLTRFFGETLPEKDIKYWADLYVQQHSLLDVKFARDDDPAAMVRAVAQGPKESCMSNRYHGNSNWYKGQVHPAAVYVSPDIEIAYALVGTEIVARAVCNRNEKWIARIYGDERRLLPALEALGYTQRDEALVGCRIRKIENENGDGFIMAYVDKGTGSGGGNLCYEPHCGGYWMLVRRGVYNTYEGYENNGVSQCEPQMMCADCDDAMDEDDSVYIDRHDRSVCTSCADHNYVTAVGRRGHEDYASTGDCVECESDNTWYIEEYANDNDVYQCEVNGTWYKSDDMVMTSQGMVHTDEAVELAVDDSDGNSWAVENDTVTTHDGRVIHKDNAVMRTVWFHEDDDIENDQTPVVAAQQVA